MAKARAIVKRRKAVRNIRKITKTMQMIATAKFQKAVKRSASAKPYNNKVRELVGELAANIGDVKHPLLRQPSERDRSGRVAVVVLTSNRGLAGAYNGSVLRRSNVFIREQEAAGKQVDLYVAGKKGGSYFNYQRRPVVQRLDQFADTPRWEDVSPFADALIERFVSGQVDAVSVAYMNFHSAGVQRPEVLDLLPLAAPKATRGGAQTLYDFHPDARQLLDDLLPLTVRTALFQCVLDAASSEHVARMIAMKSATDNADKMVKSLTMKYNRARQSQITTELSEIMGGVEAMKSR